MKGWNGWNVATAVIVAGLTGVLVLLAQTGSPDPREWWSASETDQDVVPEPEVSETGSRKSEPEDDLSESREEAMEQELTEHFSRVADSYEKSSRYPPYSLPINEDTVDDYRYNTYTPVDIPVSDDGDVRIRILLDGLHFQRGDPIIGVVTIVGGEDSDVRLEEARLRTRQGENVYSEELDASGPGEYELVLSPSESESSDWPLELFVVVEGQYLGEDVSAVAPVRYDDPVGKVVSVSEASVDGPHLTIPVEAEVEESGFYAISGNLYTQAGRPIVHIEHETEMSGADSEAELRVHRQALEAAGDEGPYELGNLRIRQLPAQPGDRTRFGPEVEERFEVQGFAFDRYSDEQYSDPMREARLEFLRNAAQGQ